MWDVHAQISERVSEHLHGFDGRVEVGGDAEWSEPRQRGGGGEREWEE